MTRSLLLTLTLSLATAAFAQETPPPATTATATTAEATTTTAEADTAETATAAAAAARPDRRTSTEIRNLFSNVLSEHPPELATILKLDPSLLSNDAFLAGYPALAE